MLHSTVSRSMLSHASCIFPQQMCHTFVADLKYLTFHVTFHRVCCNEPSQGHRSNRIGSPICITYIQASITSARVHMPIWEPAHCTANSSQLHFVSSSTEGLVAPRAVHSLACGYKTFVADPITACGLK